MQFCDQNIETTRKPGSDVYYHLINGKLSLTPFKTEQQALDDAKCAVMFDLEYAAFERELMRSHVSKLEERPMSKRPLCVQVRRYARRMGYNVLELSRLICISRQQVSAIMWGQKATHAAIITTREYLAKHDVTSEPGA